MSRTLIFRFEELPLIIDLGIEAGLVNGQAVVCYWPSGEWGITSISLDGYRDRSEAERDADRAKGFKIIPRFERRQVNLEDHPLYSMIWSRLEEEWRDRVQDAVRHTLEEERAA